MVFDEVSITKEPVTEEKPVVETVVDPAINAELSDDSVENAEKEEVNTEPKKEEESSVIRNMRKQVKAQQRELAELRKAIQQPVPEQSPQRDQFASDDEYIDAKVDHRIKQVQAQPVQVNPLQQKFEEVRKLHTDFDDALSDIEHVRFSADAQRTLTEAMAALPQGAEVLYHIAKNPELAEEISILPPAALAVRLGEIHSDIKREKTKKPQTSKAPAPIKPVAGSSTQSKNYDEMTDDEFLQIRRKERAAHKMRFA